MSSLFFGFLDKNGDGGGELPPGTPPTQRFEGPWFETQLTISATIGIVSFLLFSYCRTRWPLLFAPRTKLKGFSPHEAHAHQAFFGWIIPTIRTSEFAVLQIVGLDAAVLLNFFKMSFYLFSVCSLFALTILMPLNWKHNKELEPDDDDWPGTEPPPTKPPPRDNFTFHFQPPGNRTGDPLGDWLDLINDANSYLSVHLIFTYLFTILALYFIYQNYRRFIRSRQLFSLELVHSIPARTVLVTNLPNHLQGERPLAEYFENMELAVESVTVCREVSTLKKLLDDRTEALLELEKAWVSYVGNPSSVEEYDPEVMDSTQLVDADLEDGRTRQERLVVPHRRRPTIRPGWFKPKVDALEYLERKFREADELVKKKRRTGRFRATRAAFVTFEKMSSAQVALQVAHTPHPGQMTTYPAPEPRDIVWSNMAPSALEVRTRDIIVLACMGLVLLFWVIPVSALASLMSYKEVKKSMPWLGRLIDQNDKIRALVQNSLPSMAMILLNACLPFILEGLTYLQGFRARSWIEYSLLKKYFLFLLINVVFIFLVASTYWQLVRELANSPAKVPEKLARALQAGRARHFFLSYVILQGFGIMPLQLLNLGVIIPRIFYRMFLTRTPRDYAELNAPPMINYGVVYPQAILMFVITLLYSVVQPLILVFGAFYFGMAYIVYKYKLLFVFYKPYESQGQAWPITFVRLIWGVVIFLLFMIGIFTLRQSFIISSLLLPLLAATIIWSWYVQKTFKPLSKFVSLSSVCEVQRGEETADVLRLKAGHPVTWSQSNLNRRRYAQNDDTLYVAPEDERTDYSQPPMAGWYDGVLNTGKRRYGHPALTGVLPEPWLPLKKGQTLANHNHRGDAPRVTKDNEAVVLTLRKRYNSVRGARPPSRTPSLAGPSNGLGTAGDVMHDSGVQNPWEDSPPRPHRSGNNGLNHRLSFDVASGVIMLPESGDWLQDDTDSDEEDFGTENTGGLDRSITEASDPGNDQGSTSPTTSPSRTSRYGTYFHHPERRRQPIPGAFPGR
ncbi:putative cytosolic domain of 10TM putative phosphate transporter [Lyophyllum shimeji]|uniref:Cytosolic domain of 10TM putative phosphate transporter n=1 Tax=Lyophyllum shimeji TaxID=47721 RepID=A0A9P3PT58_LYOSH|nr:putative cytosolic domain of 10TM putative phosphate transporter [Lyophyllum shimeji]